MADNLTPPDRLRALPPYLFAEVDRVKRELIQQGKDVIDLGVADPDIPTPKVVIDELCRAAKDPKNHRYALDGGLPGLRQEIVHWYKKRFGVGLDRDTEVLPLIGAKEGIGHLPLALLNPGDAALIPNPGYPVYRSSTIFAGAEPMDMPLVSERNFLPDLDRLSSTDLERVKLMFLNYPNNPTGACAEESFFREVVKFASRSGVVVAHDFAYGDVAFGGYRPPSFLSVEGAREVGIEFYSLSKTCNMTGWRLGFAVGNRDILVRLAKIKANLDSGIFQAIQLAGVKALEHGEEIISENMAIYTRRRNMVVDGLRSIGMNVTTPKAALYIWAPVPKGFTSNEFSTKLLKEAYLVVTPGDGFGSAGAGYFRISLTVPDKRLGEAVSRIKKLKFN